MAEPKLVSGIQYLRGFAALLVVLAHTNAVMGHQEYMGRLAFGLQNTGVFGVTIFFVISGFIISIVSLTPDGRSKLSVSQFAARRFRRIVPFLWVCIIGYNIFTFAGTGQVEWGPAIRALFLWPIGDLKPNVTWTLRHEAIFYGIFALTLLSARRRPMILAGWFCAPLVVSSAAAMFPAWFAGLHPYVQDLVNVVLVGRGANLQFGLGVILGLLWMRGHRLLQPTRFNGPLPLLAVTIAATLIYETLTPIWLFNPNNLVPVAQTGPLEIIVISALAVMVVWCGATAVESRNGKLEQLARLLGDASYSIYLVHSAAILALLELWNRIPAEIPLPILCIGFAIVATIFGIVVHFLIERPMLRAFAQRRALRPAASN